MLPQIHVKLRKDKIKDGKQAVIIQVYHNGKQKQIFTGIYIEPEHFNPNPKDRGKYITKVRNKDLLNSIISNKIDEFEKNFLSQKLTKGHIELSATHKVTKSNFKQYAHEMYDNMKNRCSPDYIYRAKAAIDDFVNFAGNVSFQAINPQLLQDYEDHLFKRNLQRNTVNRIFRRLKQVFTDAARKKVITENPFMVFKPVSAQQTKREFLTVEEIEKLEQAKIPEIMESVRDYFLLSCYTGLRFSDLRKWDKAKFVTKNKGVERIIIGTQKTGEVVSIKLSKKVKDIIDRINKPLPTNIHTNRVLKTISQLAETGKELTFHMARHSAAVNMASAGLPIEAVGKILGHSSIKTTAIYFKITDKKLDEYMDNFDKFLGSDGEAQKGD